MRRLGKYAMTALFVLYMAALLTITVVRPWSGPYQLLGGSLHARVLVDYVPILRTSPGLFLYLFGGNILWFVPFGFYLAWRRGLQLRFVVLYGFQLSLFIEAMQFVLGTGVSELDDLLLNTAGSLAGGALGGLARKAPKTEEE